MEPSLKMFYMKKISGGRSFLARTVDFIILRAFILIMLFFIILYMSLSTTVALLMSIFITAAISLLLFVTGRKHSQKKIIKVIEQLKQKCLLEELTFKNEMEYYVYINTLFKGNIKRVDQNSDGFSGYYGDYMLYALQNHPRVECGIADTLKILRKYNSSQKFIIISLSEFSDDAKRMCASLEREIILIDGNKIIELAKRRNMMPDEQCAEERAAKEISDAAVTFQKIKKNALSKVKIKGYIMCGIIIMLWPVIAGFEFYYPIIAVACFALAIYTYKKSSKLNEESPEAELY